MGVTDCKESNVKDALKIVNNVKCLFVTMPVHMMKAPYYMYTGEGSHEHYNGGLEDSAEAAQDRKLVREVLF